jgi:predicted enzyme related to lactoylglutathione lyase
MLKIGSVGWMDLTVPDAEKVKSFYEQVVGWKSSGVDMIEYEDYCMNEPDSEKPVAGICHARGTNADLPPQWLIYISVADLEASMASCRALGGEVIAGSKSMGETARYCVIRDPAGAVAGLYQEGS